MVRDDKKKYLYVVGILIVALVAIFWVSTANTIDDASEFTLAKPASDLVDRERLVVAPEITTTDLMSLVPLPDLVFQGTGVYSADRGTVDPDTRIPRQLIPKDGIRPVYDPTFVAVPEVILSRDELVIGLTINGDSRAYPISVLQRREMVNDVVGGVPILATW